MQDPREAEEEKGIISFIPRGLPSNEEKVDVVIVGSGLSGLATAYYLQRAGARTCILEAGDRVGGRTRSEKLTSGPEYVSVGGTWCMFEDWATLQFAKEVNCMPINPDLSIQSVCTTMIFYPWLGIKLWFLGRDLWKETDGKWWNHPDAAKLDSISLEQWLNEGIHLPKSKQAVREWFTSMETFPPVESISALWAAALIYDRVQDVLSLDDGLSIAKTWRWENGTGVFVDAITKKYLKSGGKVIKNAPARRITQDSEGVKIYSPDIVISAKKAAVSAAPNAAIMGIQYDPPLPELQAILMGSVTASFNPSYNVILVYDSPWWRDEDVGTFILPCWSKDPFYQKSSDPSEIGVYGTVMELTPTDVKNPRGIIRILTTPGHVEGKSLDQIAQSAAGFMASFYDEEQVKEKWYGYQNYQIFNWMGEMPHIPGVTYHWGIGSLSLYGDHLRDPFNNIHWGGSERALHGSNWMEGAVQRGMQVAVEIGKEIGKPVEKVLGKNGDNNVADMLDGKRKRKGILDFLGAIIKSIFSIFDSDDTPEPSHFNKAFHQRSLAMREDRNRKRGKLLKDDIEVCERFEKYCQEKREKREREKKK